jgi:FkbM family methyltransferase
MQALLDILFNNKLSNPINGVIHVGAHHGQEVPAYQNYNIRDIVLIEPSIEAYNIISSRYQNDTNIELFNLAAGSFNGVANFFTETKNKGQSNSLLKPKTHLSRHPRIKFNNIISINVKTLDSIIINKFKYNLLVLDTQGYELEVLKGAAELLNNIDYIISEVSTEELYEKCAIIDDLDAFLSEYSFNRQNTHWWRKGKAPWGDALYIKQK